MQKKLERLQGTIPPNAETILRAERLDLLVNAAKENDLGAILTGHHEDDQYETVIQRLAWGSSLAGLGGIPPVNGLFRRPLLEYPKVVPLR
jgi:tRNA(Ile)-lysidine synthase